MSEQEGSNPLTARLIDDKKSEESFLPSFDEAEATPLDSSNLSPVPLETMRGEKQPSKLNRDWPFGVLFYLQFIFVIVLGSIKADRLIHEENDPNRNTSVLTLMTVLRPILASAVTAIILTQLGLIILTKMAASFILCSVWFGAVLFFLIAVMAFSGGVNGLGIICLFSSLMGCCYALAVRDRIPFAAANLNAGISSIKSNCGITLISILFTLILSVWLNLWATSVVLVMDVREVCDENGGGDESDCTMQVQYTGWFILWILFFLWTSQVFKNVIHTTVSGIVGTWYFDPEGANSFCSSAIFESLYRSLTYSFGSICFGSLLVAFLQTLNTLVQNMRRQQTEDGQQQILGALLLCCLDCLLRLLGDIIEYFNKWAFIYVGLYGYPYVTAGKKVVTLFKERGWTVIINDNLIRNALGYMNFMIGIVSGLVSLLFAQDNPLIFFIGFLVGLLISSTVMSIIDTAVSTIIVCFAEAPAELEQNHSTHSRNMREAWNKVYDINF